MIIGIDLGTTNSVAAYLTNDGPKLIPNALGEMLTPSVVGFDLDGKALVGRVAQEWQVTHPELCASLFKRFMGSDRTYSIARQKFTPEQLSGFVLRSLKEDAEAFLQQPIRQAVVTVPAYFNDQQRKATLNAGRIAGLEVDRIVNEPTAAAMAYGFHEIRENKLLLIFDLGGGTFDVSLVELFDGILEVKASSGESVLGGEDFTRMMAARVMEGRGLVFEHAELRMPLLVARLLRLCEQAKCRLAREPRAEVRVPDERGELNDSSPVVEVSRTRFEEWTHGVLGRVEIPLRRVLGDAGIKPADVHEVILVGGATRMPAVIDLVGRFFQKIPHYRINPDEVVALGAAVQGGLLMQHEGVRDLVVTDVAPFTLGINIIKIFGSEQRDGYFLPILHRNTTIPASRCERVSTVHPNQTEITVKIYQGEARRVEGNLYLGEFIARGIPRGPAGQEVDIRFTYDLNGVLEVEATIVATGRKVTHVITKFAQGLSKKEIDAAIAALQKFKTHPREELPNRFLLRRAERVYQELSHEGRIILGQLLDGFEAALELQDPNAIAKHREQLKEFLNRNDPEHQGDGPEDDEPA